MSQPLLIANRYKVLDSLGEGGFAHVYRAMDQEMGRTVAVKILKLELLGHATMRQTFLERFAREVSVTASLEHPHLVPVYDTGMTQDDHGQERPYLVMKLLEGQDLESTLERSGPLSVKDVLRIGEQALDALAYVHDQGVVHKDLKPANLFLSRDRRGEPHLYIMDFGIAHDPRDGGGRMTQTGAFTGTLQYLAPEYLLEQIAAPCVDVYQMGLILVELLCNRPLVSHETTMPELIAKYIRREPILLPESLEDMASGEVFARATNFDHRLRYQDAGAFLEAWEALDEEDFPATIGDFSARDTISARAILNEHVEEVSASDDEPVVRAVLALAPTLREGDEAVSGAAFAPTLNGDMEALPSRGSSRMLWGVAVLIFAFIVAGVVVVAALSTGPEPPPLTPPSLEPVITSPEPVKIAKEVVLVDPKREDPVVDLSAHVTTVPAGASVSVDGVLAGTTPITLSFSKPVELRLELEGYEPITRRDYMDGKPLELELVKIKAPLDEKKRPDPEPKNKPIKVEPVEVKDERPTTTLPPEF